MASKRILASAATALLLYVCASAQTVKKNVVEEGGSGPFKAEIVCDESISTHTIYRPQNMKSVVEAQGKLPVILYANGACANDNVEMRLLLNEVASHGYIVIAIGPYDENDTVEKWKEVLMTSYPEGKNITFANGEKFTPPTDKEKEEFAAKRKAMIEAAQKEAAKASSKKKNAAPAAPQAFRTYPKQLLEAMDWITEQNAVASSEYYHLIDLDKVAVMGQSCGGAQALAVAHDPRIKTCIILNSGIADMEMSGASKESLKNLHTPMFYLNGGPIDIAYPNANLDFSRIENLPVVLYSSTDGHNGTYYEKNGGAYAIAVTRWLDWQLKGQQYKSAVFYDDEYAHQMFPTWTFRRKNM
ncbi:MAG: prolyl oligopeptidase family serine peptidase [Bacteroidales bacterium]|nr:prolyl oligopeptidase family serine peptidase [Bacteroidales bacterium]